MITDEQKVYIRGVEGRGDEVIKMLMDLGAKNKFECHGDDPHAVYFITHNGLAASATDNSEMANMLMEYCHEVHLPEQWKDGDVLINKKYSDVFAVFKEGCRRRTFGYTFLCADFHYGYISTVNDIEVNKFRSATEEEIIRFHDLLHKHGKDWDVEKQQLVNWRWKPKDGETFYYFDEIGQILSDSYDDFSNGPISDFGNCFRTREEAEAAAERVKKVLNENQNV